MLKTRNRFIATILLPCVLLDSSWANTFDRNRIKTNQSSIETQALAAPMRWARIILLGDTGAIEDRRLLMLQAGAGIVLMGVGVAQFALVRQQHEQFRGMGAIAPLWERNFEVTLLLLLPILWKYRYRKGELANHILYDRVVIDTTPWKGTLPAWFCVSLLGIVYVLISTTLNFCSFAYVSPNVANLINGTGAGWVFVFNAFLYRKEHENYERMTLQRYVGLASLGGSLVWAALYGLEWGGLDPWLGVNLAAASMFGWAIFQSAIRVMTPSIGRPSLLAGGVLVGQIGLTLLRWIYVPKEVPYFVSSITGWAPMMVMVVCITLGISHFAEGIKRIKNSGLGAMIASFAALSFAIPAALMNVESFPWGKWWVFALNFVGLTAVLWKTSSPEKTVAIAA